MDTETFDDFLIRIYDCVNSGEMEKVSHADVVDLFALVLIPRVVDELDALIVTRKGLKDMVAYTIGTCLREVTLVGTYTPDKIGEYLDIYEMQLTSAVFIDKITRLGTNAISRPDLYVPWYDRVIDDITFLDMLSANLYNIFNNTRIRGIIGGIIGTLIAFWVIK